MTDFNIPPRFSVADYTIILKDGVPQAVQRSDGASIPLAPGNRDYNEYLKVTEGQTVATREMHTVEAKWAEVKALRDSKLQAIEAIGEVVLYLAESEAIKAGKLTAAERTITGAQAIQKALYIRNLYRVMQQSDPDHIVWPADQ